MLFKSAVGIRAFHVEAPFDLLGLGILTWTAFDLGWMRFCIYAPARCSSGDSKSTLQVDLETPVFCRLI